MQGVLSWSRIENPGIHAPNIKDAPKELQRLGDELIKCGQVLSFIQQFPNSPIQNGIRANFGRLAIVKEYTKKRRTYSISYLTITEED